MDRERSEDLNPVSEDIEEKVRQMLDPSIPDTPELPKAKVDAKKTITIQAISEPVDGATSAPTVSVDKSTAASVAPPSEKKSKKVIIPIDHKTEDDPKPEKPKTPTPKKASTAKKIVIADHSDDPKEVAKKLDATIAELDQPKADVVVEATTAPELETTQDATDDVQPVVDVAAKPTKPSITKKPDREKTIGDMVDELEKLEDPAILDDPATDKAVADIVAAESDQILQIEDAVKAQAPKKQIPQKAQPKKEHKGLKKFLKKTAIIILLLGLVAAAITPTSRYFILNTAGVRAKSSMKIVDDQTGQVLRNAQVTIGTVSAITDDTGAIQLAGLRLGRQQMTVSKSAFAPITRYITIGWGSNPLGDVGLTLTGTQYSFLVTDYLSDKPLTSAIASSTDADASGNDKGVIKLSLANPGDQPFKVVIKRDGYRDEEVGIQPADKGERKIKLVPARKHAYVSKRTGKADIYSSYVDGADEKLVLAGSGKEQDGMVLAPHPTDNIIVFVSTRAGQTNKNGETLSNLLLLNLNEDDPVSITAAEQIKLISWAGDRLIYVQTTVDAKADATDRYKLMSYNYKDGSNKELVKANFFNDVIAIGNTVYFALSSAYQSGTPGLYRINPDGTNSENIYNKEVWNVFRTAYDHLTLSVQQEWYDLSIGSKQPVKLNTAPAEQLSRVYIDSPDGKQSVRIDNRDGKGVLLVYDLQTKIEKELKSQGGITYPVRWINDRTVVYRLKTSSETADYVMSLDGGESRKLKDVTSTLGFFRWLY